MESPCFHLPVFQFGSFSFDPQPYVMRTVWPAPLRSYAKVWRSLVRFWGAFVYLGRPSHPVPSLFTGFLDFSGWVSEFKPLKVSRF